MCGVAGTIGIRNNRALTEMLGALQHRGPDDEGEYYDANRGVALGHRRLSIIDLSQAGHQPMASEDGSVVVVFNGEIYNYKQLTGELRQQGFTFRSTSDTEVLVHGYRAWGSDVFKKIDGMWAVALYDKRAGKLFLSRDPAGIKPLYLYKKGTTLAFSSEIGALARVPPQGSLAMNEMAMRAYLTHGYIYGTDTMYREITSVPPATTLTISLPDLSTTSETHFIPERHTPPKTLREAVDEFEKIFADSVQATLQADVPVGLFLSGGIDSSLVGYQVKQAGAQMKAFTIGFDEQGFDESRDAARIAEHFGFPLETVIVRGSDIVPEALRVLDSFGQPFADMSALVTDHLSRFAREQGCTVALTGDGADELFGGYPTHYLPKLAAWYQKMPRAADAILDMFRRALPRDFSKLGNREKLTRFLEGARHPVEAAHARWKSVFTENELAEILVPDTLTNRGAPDFAAFFDMVREASSDAADLVSKVDFLTFLTSDCLVKSDIASMQHGVELRVPFLNKALIDFAWNLPGEMKASPFHTKKVLRQSLARALPRSIARAPKRGFVPPLAHWLMKELKPLMCELLSEDAIAKVGFLQYAPVAELVEQHLAGREDHAKKLWALMSLSRFVFRASHEI
ncbi:MAG: asparagine synthase (glutamine-hydrolyzing) [Candidatus Parcubacteria bacterium]|nr:asparagine synthase (glutamine-hydrolyzing) [Candidatus Parcubacteria bacterium]